MKKFDLLPFRFNKAFLHPEYIEEDKVVIGCHICINDKGEKLFELPDKEMIAVEFDDNDVAIVHYKNKSALINAKGEFLTAFIEENIFNYDEEYKVYSLCGKNGYGIINSLGKIIIPPIYDTEIYFYDDIATVKKNNTAGGFDINGNNIIPFVYKKLGIYSNGLICAKKQDDTSGYIDKNNNIIIPFGKYSCNSDFNSNVVIVYDSNKGNIYIDLKGNEVELKF